MDRDAQRFLKPFPEGGALLAAGDIDRLHGVLRALARIDRQVPPDLAGQGRADREGTRVEERLAAADVEFRPVLGNGQRGDHGVRGLRCGHLRRFAGHGPHAGDRPERPGSDAGELESRGLAQLLIGSEQLFPQNERQRAPVLRPSRAGG